MRVLIAEDDSSISELLVTLLRKAGFAPDACDQGDVALDVLLKGGYDAAVLDVMLPGLNGTEIVRRLRDRGNTVPVLMLTALGAIDQRVEGLEAGADDYLAKPFSLNEVIARLRAMARRAQMPAQKDPVVWKVADLVMDPARREIRRDGRRLDLSTREFLMMEVLFRHAGHVCSRRLLLEKVWEYNVEQGSNLVEVYIGRLRQKVDFGYEVKLLHTIRGEGYMLGEGTPCAGALNAKIA